MNTTQLAARLTLVKTDHEASRDLFAHDIVKGLQAQPKHLSCHYFYDQRGSALFEAICALPEYYLTRAESQILSVYADEIAACFDQPVSLIEFGSGSAIKTRLLIDAFCRRQQSLLYAPVDISRTALELSALELLKDYASLQILGVAGLYEEGLAHLQQAVDSPRLILWLGSSVGNFTAVEAARFLSKIASHMDAEDRLLIGMDLHKDRSVLERAYDDAQGVTADFNLNLLARINDEFAANFDLTSFAHRAHYNEGQRRMEMHLVSRQAQNVTIKELNLEISFAEGEHIHTENSHKYRQGDIEHLLQSGGFVLQHQYFDDKQRFTLNLARPAAS